MMCSYFSLAFLERWDSSLSDAIEHAINRCIDEDVLKEFLVNRREEVAKVTNLDFTSERQIELEREEAKKTGVTEAEFVEKMETASYKILINACIIFAIFLRYQCCVMQIILSTFPGAMTVLLMCVTLRKHLEILATMCFVLTESRHRRIGIRGSIPFIIYRLVSMQSGMKI